MPKDFAAALETAGLASFFADCTPAHQREYLKWVIEAKRSATRQTRIAKAIQMISEKRDQDRKTGSIAAAVTKVISPE